MAFVLHRRRHHMAGEPLVCGDRSDRGGEAQMKKTRSQRQREREQAIFIAITSAGIVALVAVILWKAVTG